MSVFQTIPASPLASSASTSTKSVSSSSDSPAFGPTFLCEHCERPTQFASISRILRLVRVSRSTIYYWMDRGWIHWRVLPSGRRVICQASLSRPAKESTPKLTSAAGGAANS